MNEVIKEHEDCLSKIVHAEEKVRIPLKDIQDQCFIAATRSRSKEASEKVPDIFPLEGEHRKPEYLHKPKKDRLHQPIIEQPGGNEPPVVQMQPQVLRDISQDIGVNHLTPQKGVQELKGTVGERNRAFQLSKSESFGVTNNVELITPNFTQQLILDFNPRPIRNVTQDPITQHTDQRAKPKVYESLIKPMPVDVQVQGTLPPYDVDRIWEEFDLTPPKD